VRTRKIVQHFNGISLKHRYSQHLGSAKKLPPLLVLTDEIASRSLQWWATWHFLLLVLHHFQNIITTC